MSETTPISLAKLHEGNYIFSLTPFDPNIRGDLLAYPSVRSDQLKVIQEGTPDQVQQVLASLTNL